MYAFLKEHEITLEEYIDNSDISDEVNNTATGYYAFCDILYDNREITASGIEEYQRGIDELDSIISEGGWKVTSGENILYIKDNDNHFAFLGGYTIYALECLFSYELYI